ncbi:MAG: sodium:proton antiporter, partial [Desulfobacterales bacterium]|nr:sodium:proton antiporter [Desulfobacterales bacterium]
MKFVKLIVMIFVLSSFVFLVSAVVFDNTVEATQDTGTGHVAGETGHGDVHADSGSHGHGHINLGEVLPLWSCIPFACMLLSIALFPLLAPRLWQHHCGKVSAFCSVSSELPFLM